MADDNGHPAFSEDVLGEANSADPYDKRAGYKSRLHLKRRHHTAGVAALSSILVASALFFIIARCYGLIAKSGGGPARNLAGEVCPTNARWSGPAYGRNYNKPGRFAIAS